MANITIAIDQGVLQRARRKATEQRTSLNALIAEYLTHDFTPGGRLRT